MDIEDQLNLMEKYRLTAEEVLLIDLLFLASLEENHGEYLVKYLSFSDINLRNLLISLQDKKVILKSYKVPDKGEVFDPESVEFNKIFLDNYRKFSGILGEEFFNHYPSIGIINGNEVPLKNFAKKFNSEQEFFYAYGKTIGWKLKNHQEVLDLVDWAKENDCKLLNMNISDFVVSGMWRSIKELKEGNGVMHFDTMKTI